MDRSPNGYWELERAGLTMPVRVDRTGKRGPTRDQARGGRWRQTSWGLHVPSSVSDEDVEQRIVEAAAVVPEGGAVTGWAALRWQGGVWFDGLMRGGRARRPVTVVAPSKQIRAQAGIEVSEEFIRPGEIIRVDGLPITSPARSVCFLMRYAPRLREAVVALDMAAYDDLVSIAEAATYAASLATWTGIPQCREAIALGEENSWSPQEVGAGFAWVRVAGLPRPLRNRPVFDLHGRHIGTPDLLDEEAGLVGEYDGRLHLTGNQRRTDRDREAAYRAVGLEVVVLLDTDAVSPGAMAALILAARARARFEPESTRRWTTVPPPWWVPTFTVEQRRALDPQLRERWLRYRRQTG